MNHSRLPLIICLVFGLSFALVQAAQNPGAPIQFLQPEVEFRAPAGMEVDETKEPTLMNTNLEVDIVEQKNSTRPVVKNVKASRVLVTNNTAAFPQLANATTMSPETTTKGSASKAMYSSGLILTFVGISMLLI